MFEISAPNIHPLIIHAPLAFLPLALLLEVLALWQPMRSWLDRVVTALWVLGALGAAAAYRAGRAAADGLTHISPQAHADVGLHADAAWAVLGLSAAIAIARSAFTWVERRHPHAMSQLARAILVVAGGSLAGLLFQTAERGGQLVYGHGLGVTMPTPPPCPICPTVAADPASSTPEDRPLLTERGGTLTWTPRASDMAKLQQGGDAQVVSADDHTLRVDGVEVLLLPGMRAGVHVNVWMVLTDFQGEISLLHHVREQARGAVVLTDAGSVLLKQGPTDSMEVLDEGTTPIQTTVALSVSANGSHLKGLVDGKVVVHGHGAALPPGQVGIELRGTGLVRINKLDITPLDGD